MGLIGGSVFKALKKRNVDCVCVSSNPKTTEQIQKTGTEISDKLEILKDCEIIFVCSPMRNTPEILDKLENIISKKTIVTDVCSLKEFVSRKKRPYVFIPSHPMAGKESSGFDVSCEDLFEGAKWVLTPFENTSEKDIEKLKKLIHLTGAETILTTAKEHDRAVALISHMPMVLSQALVDLVKDNVLAKKLASSGFRDMTRLSLSNTVMAQDMVEINNQNIQQALSEVFDKSENLLNTYTQENIEEIKKIRSSVYSKDGKNIF